MKSFLGYVLRSFYRYSSWILWNLFLAFIPLTLSFWLFRRRGRSRSFLWWIGLVVFIAFLPNAPYLLTDIIHLIEATRSIESNFFITLVFIPLHLIAILLGFEAYVIALINQGHYLRRQGAAAWVTGSELLVHGLCAIGIYLGRFQRFNSWDLVTEPADVMIDTANALTTKFPVAVILITFVILTVFYWLMKQITLGIVLRIRYGLQHAKIKSGKNPSMENW